MIHLQLTTHYSLLTAYGSLLTTDYSRLTTHGSLLVQVRQGEAARRTAWHNMLDPKQLVNKNLTPVELEAVSSFLAANVSAFAMDLIAPMALQAQQYVSE